MPRGPSKKNPVSPEDRALDFLVSFMFGGEPGSAREAVREQPDLREGEPGLDQATLGLDFLALPAVKAGKAVTKALLDAHVTGPVGLNAQRGHITFHGGRNSFKFPSSEKIGSGQGQEAFGPGFYSAESPHVADMHRLTGTELTFQGSPFRAVGPQSWKVVDRLSSVAKYISDSGAEVTKQGLLDYLDTMNQALKMAPGPEATSTIELNKKAMNFLRAGGDVKPTQGSLLKVHIPDEDVVRYLDWDKPLAEQGPAVKKRLRRVFKKYFDEPDSTLKNFSMSDVIGEFRYDPEEFNKFFDDLRRAGIRGVKYLDGYSRRGGSGTKNYVSFKPERLKVVEDLSDIPREQARKLKNTKSSRPFPDQRGGIHPEVLQDLAAALVVGGGVGSVALKEVKRSENIKRNRPSSRGNSQKLRTSGRRGSQKRRTRPSKARSR